MRATSVKYTEREMEKTQRTGIRQGAVNIDRDTVCVCGG